MRTTGLFTQSSNKLEASGCVATKRIKDSYFNIGMCIQNSRSDIAPPLINIVNQESDPYTTVSSFVELIDKKVSDDVVVDHVILGIDATFSGLCKGGTGHKSVEAVVEKKETRLTGMPLGAF